jgi:transposase
MGSERVRQSGSRIIEAILSEERDSEHLAALCSTRIKASRQTVAKSLYGNWDEALLFCLKTALEIYRFSEDKIQDCDTCIERRLATFV